MKFWRRVVVVVVFALLAVEQAWLVQPVVREWLFPRQRDPAIEGRELAQRLGCFACHGPGGGAGISNPGSHDGVVPALSGGEMMMWADSEEELREWILYGHRLSEESDFERSGLTAGQGSGRALVMPAFSPYISDDELESLVVYLKANSGLHFPDDKNVTHGLELAHELGCFSCHGPMGIGGVANPDSLKGYVPGFFGVDYADLVTSADDARQWISDGVSKRLSEQADAQWLIAGQAIKMPAYRDFLEPEQIDSLVALVEWLAKGHWRDAEVP